MTAWTSGHRWVDWAPSSPEMPLFQVFQTNLQQNIQKATNSLFNNNGNGASNPYEQLQPIQGHIYGGNGLPLASFPMTDFFNTNFSAMLPYQVVRMFQERDKAKNIRMPCQPIVPPRRRPPSRPPSTPRPIIINRIIPASNLPYPM